MKIPLTTVLILSIIIKVYPQENSQLSKLDLSGIVKAKKGVATVCLKKQLLPQRNFVNLDSLVLDKESNFTFQSATLKPGYYQLFYRDDRITAGIPILIDSGDYNIEITIDTTSFASKDGRVVVPKSDLKGSKDNALLDGYFNIRRHYYSNLIFPLENRIREVNGDAESPKVLDSLNTSLKILRKEMMVQLNSFVLTEMGTSIAVYQTMDLWDNSDIVFMNEVMTKFRTGKPNSFILSHMEKKYKRLISTTLLNQKPPLFVLSDSSNNQVRLEDYMGKVIVLDFWATWCGPCIKEMLAYKANYSKIAAAGIVIISISTDKSKDKWLKSLNHHKFQWINVIDNNGEIAKKYGIAEFPTNYLIDKDGLIKTKNITLRDMLKVK
jgi:peroxiredoxin